MELITLQEGLAVKGRFRFTTYDAKTKELVEERVAENLVMSGGLNLLALAANWGIMQNQNVSFGSPFSSAAANLGNAYGAVGTSSVAVASNQLALQAEIGRAILSNAAVLQSQLVYDFFFGVTQANGTIAEGGLMLQANLITTTLTQALALNQQYTNLQVVATPADIPSGATIVVGYGTGTTQVLTTTSDSPPNSTQINVATFTANANYPAAGQTTVAYTPGVMLDRSVFAVPIVKTNTQTAILEVTLTLLAG